jgi:hypothetical protein
MKPVVALDLSLFAVPSTAESSSEVQDIISRIESWASVIDRQNCTTFATLSDAVDVLRSANCFPATHNVRALLQLHDLDNVFSANDINTRLFSILQKAQRLSEIIGFEVIELDASEISGTDISKSPDLAILRSLACLLASIALAERTDLIRVTTAFPCDQTVEIRAEVSFLERQGKIEQCDAKVEAQVQVVGWPCDYLGSLDAGVVWEHADDAVQLHLAICLETANVHGVSLDELPLKGVPLFCVGSEFLPSLRSHGALSKGTLANVVRVKCSQVLFSKNQAKPKSFKETRSGDEAEAFRVHLSKDHEAFRLMYWVRPDGSTEFANIGVKQELSICKGDFRIHAAARYC